ncbi:unnamed protein product [Ectocarpus sp. 12 AP-2014]
MSTNSWCIVSRRVKIPKRHISLHKVSSDLVLRDTRPSEYASREPFVCFKDGGDGFIVPKMYGVNFIKLHNLPFEDRQRDGDSVPEISFSGSLRERQVEPVKKTIRALETKQESHEFVLRFWKNDLLSQSVLPLSQKDNYPRSHHRSARAMEGQNRAVRDELVGWRPPERQR